MDDENVLIREVSPELEGAVRALVEEFSGVFAREAVADCVVDSYQRLKPVRIPDHVPLLAYRFARERLAAAARAQGVQHDGVPSVLFVCTHNAGRSQLAAALLTHLAGGRVDVASAGSQPAAQVAPEVVQALAEIGLEAATLFPKPLTDEVIRGADVVITMGCGDSCPVVTGRRYLDWDISDPEGADADAVRRIRDDTADRVRLLVSELCVATKPGDAEHGSSRSGA